MNSGYCTRSGVSHEMRRHNLLTARPRIAIAAGDELAPSSSITSSAREISAWGTVTPSASAVL